MARVAQTGRRLRPPPGEEVGSSLDRNVRLLTSHEDVEEILRESHRRPVLLLKHSTACGISARAHAEFCSLAERWAGREDGPAFALVRVIEERPLSQLLAARLGVPHQSPQAIVIRQGRAVWHDSHYGVTAAALEAAWAAGHGA